MTLQVYWPSFRDIKCFWNHRKPVKFGLYKDNAILLYNSKLDHQDAMESRSSGKRSKIFLDTKELTIQHFQFLLRTPKLSVRIFMEYRHFPTERLSAYIKSMKISMIWIDVFVFGARKQYWFFQLALKHGSSFTILVGARENNYRWNVQIPLCVKAFVMNITEYLSSSHPDDLRYCLSIAHAVRNLEQLSQVQL